MIFLHKLLPFIVSPLFALLALVIISLITKKRIFAFIGLVLITVSSMSAVSNLLVKAIEASAPPPANMDKIQNADGIVVLSGLVSTKKIAGETLLDFGSSVDRIFAGIALMKAEKAPTLFLTRGKLPWQKGKPEGEILRQMTIEADIPPHQIALTPIVRNTAEEAMAIRQMIKGEKPHIILVTSAFHMPRALQLFSHYGFDITPYPTDYRQTDQHLSILNFIPNASALSSTSWVFREWLGRLYYQLKLMF